MSRQQQFMKRLNTILTTPTATEREDQPSPYECSECGTTEPKRKCRTHYCICCPKCGAR